MLAPGVESLPPTWDTWVELDSWPPLGPAWAIVGISRVNQNKQTKKVNQRMEDLSVSVSVCFSHSFQINLIK